MKKNELFFLSQDGKTNIHMVIWEPEDKIYGVIQLVHGVTEHIMRYEEFASYLNKGGIAVVGIDLIGHGLSTDNGNKKMYFGPEGSWRTVLGDINTCFERTKELFPDVPYIMLGFSMGSFFVRNYIIDYPNNVDGSILVGTGYMNKFILKYARKIALKEIKKYGESSITPKVNKFVFGLNNKYFKPNRTNYDWLCANNIELDNFISDPLRGDGVTCGLFRELIDGMLYTSSIDNIRKMNIFKPILVISGKDDAVGNFGKDIGKYINLIKKVGIQNVSLRLYDGMRHDVFHEEDRYKVFDDIYGWLHQYLLRSVPVMEDEISLDGVKANEDRYERALEKSSNTSSMVKESIIVQDLLKQQQDTLNRDEDNNDIQNHLESDDNTKVS